MVGKKMFISRGGAFGLELAFIWCKGWCLCFFRCWLVVSQLGGVTEEPQNIPFYDILACNWLPRFNNAINSFGPVARPVPRLGRQTSLWTSYGKYSALVIFGTSKALFLREENQMLSLAAEFGQKNLLPRYAKPHRTILRNRRIEEVDGRFDIYACECELLS